jgi:hypothetical protein
MSTKMPSTSDISTLNMYNVEWRRGMAGVFWWRREMAGVFWWRQGMVGGSPRRRELLMNFKGVNYK